MLSTHAKILLARILSAGPMQAQAMYFFNLVANKLFGLAFT